LTFDLNARLMGAEVTIKGGSIEIGQVRPLVRGLITQRGYLYDASKDGTRILAHVLSGAAQQGDRGFSEPLTLISNWPALLKK